jgi:hypothetical protein
MAKTVPSTKKKFLANKSARIAVGFDRFLLSEFRLLEDHRAFVERHFAKSVKDFEKRVEAAKAAMVDPDEEGSYTGDMSDEYFDLVERLPRLQWYAQFLIVYSSFEDALNQLCRIVKERSGFSLGFNDMAEGGITRASRYLKKVAAVESPFQTASWHRAKLLGEIRNTIAHSNGNIREANLAKEGSLAARIKDLPGLTVKQVTAEQKDADIVLSSEFLKDTISHLHTVLADVCNYELYTDT